MQIERFDQHPEPRSEQMQANWREWATTHAYTLREVVPIVYESANISLEVWENRAQVDRYLIYLPRIPHTAGDGGERLFILDESHFEFMIEAVKNMATLAVTLATEKWKIYQQQQGMWN